jgi:hypothetical protein
MLWFVNHGTHSVFLCDQASPIIAKLAVIGFLAAITGEFATGESVYSQMLSGGAGQMLLVVAAVTLASFAPAIRQVGVQLLVDNTQRHRRGNRFGHSPGNWVQDRSAYQICNLSGECMEQDTV